MNGSAGTAAAALGALADRWDREAGPIPEADRAAARAAFGELDGRADDPDQGPQQRNVSRLRPVRTPVSAGASVSATGRSVMMGAMKATWNGTVIAESDNTVVVENNHYFPADSVKPDLLRDSATTSVCPWKGTASYKTLVVDGQENTDAAWFYPAPKDAAAEIKDRFAFWKGVTVSA